MNNSTPITQKAIGIVYGIPQIGSMFYCRDLYTIPAHVIIKNKKDIVRLDSWLLPGFARPCPEFPRHGFVESRTVKCKEDLHTLLKEVKKEDKKGEIALGPNIEDIKYSSVYTSSGLLSIGPGNDGATGGKNSFSLPVSPLEFSEGFLKEVKIKDQEAVYLESVFSKDGGCYITQVRGGPEINPAITDYIPKTVKVVKVVVPSKDLLEWEKEVKTFKAGTVIYGNGYTLASHAAVHCILHKIPFVTSKKPKVGEILKTTEKGINNKLVREEFKRGVLCALNIDDDGQNLGSYFRYCLSILHNWAYLKNHPQADRMLGVSVTMFVKLCAALSFGEYRHNDTLGMFDNRWRDDIYSIVLSGGTKYLNKLPKICQHFCSNRWESGFGGLPWASCAWYSNVVWNNIIKIYNKGTKQLQDKEIACLVDYINRTVNLVHNSNWWFDKISQKGDMDLAAEYPGLSAFLVSDVFYKMSEKVQETKSTKKKLLHPKEFALPFSVNSEGKLMCAYIHPRDDSYNVRCSKCGFFDCWCKNKSSPKKSTVKFWREGEKSKSSKLINITKHEFSSLRKSESENGKSFLIVVPKVGIKLPSGRIIKCGDTI